MSVGRLSMDGNRHVMKAAGRALWAFIGKNTVMVIALAAALITSVVVPVDAQYLGYFDFKTLTCLFCVLAVVCALKNINFFYILARKIVHFFREPVQVFL